jgi:fatty-acyl-CoA synthase
LPPLPDVFDPVSWWARVHGERTAVIDAQHDRRISYRALHVEADRWQLLLTHVGVRPGDRVAILARNRYEFLPLFIACMRRGAVLVPLNWRLSARELTRVLGHAGPAVLLGEAHFRALAEEAVPSCTSAATPIRWLDLDVEVPPLLLALRELAVPASPSRLSEDTTMLLYTSGSTGAPKAVMVPHRQLLWNAMATTTAWMLSEEDVAPAATPFFHTSGWHVFVTPLLYRGGTVVVMRSFDPDAYLDALARYAVTITFGVPTQLHLLQRAASWGRPLPALRTFISGGAPCPQRTSNAVRAAGYRFREAYGLTECGPNCFATNDRTAREKDGTVGWPVPFLDMRVADENDRSLQAGEVGELQLRGPQLFGGYYRDPGQTAAVLTTDGWLRTGDLVSADAAGVFRIRGRRKELFISGGENVFPGEVEAALLEIPQVGEVCVVGVPDDTWGEVGCAVVVRTSADCSAEALMTAARRLLAGYKVPQHVLFTDRLPTLGSGKIDRGAVLGLARGVVLAGRRSEH